MLDYLAHHEHTHHAMTALPAVWPFVLAATLYGWAYVEGWFAGSESEEDR
jgi:hypothetical protein